MFREAVFFLVSGINPICDKVYDSLMLLKTDLLTLSMEVWLKLSITPFLLTLNVVR